MCKCGDLLVERWKKADFLISEGGVASVAVFLTCPSLSFTFE